VSIEAGRLGLLRKSFVLLVLALGPGCDRAVVDSSKDYFERLLAGVRGAKADSSGLAAGVELAGIPHVEPSPTEPSGNVITVPDLPLAAAVRPEDCAERAGPRRTLEPSSLKVKGTIIGGRGPVAMMVDGYHRSQVVRRGEYVGTHCARVVDISADWVSIETMVSDANGISRPRATRIYVTDQAGQ